MLPIRITVDPGNVLAREFTALEQKNLPYATVQAANATAFAVRERWADAVPRIFDRPTALTMKAPLYTKATKDKLAATIYIRDEAFKGTPPAKYLEPEVTGGARRLKRFERALQARGILPSGWFAVPGRGAELDAFGNLSGKQLVQILSQLRAFGEQGYSANETADKRAKRNKREAKKGQRRSDYFAVPTRRGGLAPGVYQRVHTGFGRGTVPILIFVRRVSYRARYPLFDIAKTIFDRRFPDNFRRELDQAVASSFTGGRK